MATLQPIANPFALLLDPQQVLASVERSDRLERLHRRICRPLDKPVLPTAKRGAATNAFDDAVDADVDELLDDDGLS